MNKQHWQDWVNGFLGFWIFISPWALQHTMPSDAVVGGLAMWNLWTVGVIVLVVAAVALFAYQAWEEWTNLILGAWLLISPWFLGFSASTALVWNAVIIGALVVLFAAWALLEGQSPQQAAQ